MRKSSISKWFLFSCALFMLWQLVISGCYSTLTGKLSLKLVDSCRVQEDSISTILQKPSGYRLFNDSLLLCVINGTQLIEYNIKTGRIEKRFDKYSFDEKQMFERFQDITLSYTRPQSHFMYLSYEQARKEAPDHKIYTIYSDFWMDGEKNIYIAFNFLEMHYFPLNDTDTIPPFNGIQGGWHFAIAQLDSSLHIRKWYNISTVPVTYTDGRNLNIYIGNGFAVNNDTLYSELVTVNRDLYKKPVMVGKFVYNGKAFILKDTIPIPYNPELIKKGGLPIGNFPTSFVKHGKDFFVSNGKKIYCLQNAMPYMDNMISVKDSQELTYYSWSTRYNNIIYTLLWDYHSGGGNEKQFRLKAYNTKLRQLVYEKKFTTDYSYTGIAGDDKVVTFFRKGDFYYIKTYEFIQKK